MRVVSRQIRNEKTGKASAIKEENIEQVLD